MNDIAEAVRALEALGVPREDNAMLLPLGMSTKIVCKHNLRNLLDMSRQRMCTRAYHEYRALFNDVLQNSRHRLLFYNYIFDRFQAEK